MAQSTTSLVINIKLNRMFIVQRLSESIAENLRRDFRFNTTFYCDLCKEVLYGAGLDRKFAKDLMIDVVTMGYYLHFNYKKTGQYTYHNGSGAHPAILVSKEAEDLCTLIGLLTRDQSELSQVPSLTFTSYELLM